MPPELCPGDRENCPPFPHAHNGEGIDLPSGIAGILALATQQKQQQRALGESEDVPIAELEALVVIAEIGLAYLYGREPGNNEMLWWKGGKASYDGDFPQLQKAVGDLFVNLAGRNGAPANAGRSLASVAETIGYIHAVIEHTHEHWQEQAKEDEHAEVE